MHGGRVRVRDVVGFMGVGVGERVLLKLWRVVDGTPGEFL